MDSKKDFSANHAILTLVENIQKAQGQGVSYNKKLCGKHGFPNLANSRTSQFVSQIRNRVSKCKNCEFEIQKWEK